MLFVYVGTDRKKARDAMNTAIEKAGKDRTLIRITDAHSLADLDAALSGAGLFGEARVVVLDGVLANPEMRERALESAARMAESPDPVFLFDEKFDAAAKRMIGKHAEKVETFDAPKRAADNAIFSMRYALERGDKKALWISLMHEYASGKAPEAVHGFLFWAAKQMVLSAKNEVQHTRARKLLARLAELPHESRRKGVELDYALERFALSEV